MHYNRYIETTKQNEIRLKNEKILKKTPLRLFSISTSPKVPFTDTVQFTSQSRRGISNLSLSIF